MRGMQRKNPRPILTKAEWGCLSGYITWKEYSRAPTHVVWMWMFQKKLTGGNGHRSRVAGIQTLRMKDAKSNREEMCELAKSNSMLQGAIAKAKGGLSF